VIKASVGYCGTNYKNDVVYVQTLLNKNMGTPPLAIDGVCGKNTISAIVNFQAEIVCLSKPDGRIDPGGVTIKHLEHAGNAFSRIPTGTSVGIRAIIMPTGANALLGKGLKIFPIATPLTDPRTLKTRQDIANVYGTISSEKRWARQPEFLRPYVIPDRYRLHQDYCWTNVYSQKKDKVGVVYCHSAMHAYLDKALANLLSRNLLKELKEYGGCHNIRATRGTANWSAHSWALAIDINMTGNELGKEPSMRREFANCFIDAGFGWGGDYSRKDGMHFTLAGFDMPKNRR
jgi:hypothetical protein